MYTKRVRKLVGKLQSRLHIKDGYLLPVVIGLGMGISIVSVTALQVISQNSTTLNTQYYIQLATEAARAGTSAAINCIGSNTTDWDTSGKPKLQPQTDCHGADVQNKLPTVLNQNNTILTTYTVKALEQPYGSGSRIITSTGKTTIKDSSGNVLASFSKTIRTMGRLNSSGGTAVTDIDTATSHTCAVAGGQAYCWGGGGFSSADTLGTGLGGSSEVPVAVDTTGVLSGKTVTAITTGSQHTCAVASGQAYCWGSNTNGQFGNNSTSGSSVPVAVVPSGALSGKTVTAIDAGEFHTCAIANGAAYCWGGSGLGSGELGNGANGNSNVPVAVNTSGVLNGKTVTDISAGKNHSCAVADGKAYCWGNNFYGQLGDNTTTNSNVPVAVTTFGAMSGKTVTAISAGNGYTCAVADGKAYCWGTNGNALAGGGQIGDGSFSSSKFPVAVATWGVLNGKSVTAISAGDAHTCAVADGKAYCWGKSENSGIDTSSALGNGSTADSNLPVAVSTSGTLSGATVTLIAAGKEQSCAVADGGATCWGDDMYYQLGNGSATSSTTTPANAGIQGALSGKTVTDIGSGYFHSCAVASNNAYCWGQSPNGQVGNGAGGFSAAFKVFSPVAVSTSGVLSGKSVTKVDTGDTHSCAVASNQTYCWGGNLYGQLGNNSTSDSYTPVAVSTSGVLSGKNVTAVGLGASHSCVVASSQAYCWGDNSQYELGNGSGGPGQKSAVPVAVSTSGVLNSKTVSDIDGGSNHTCTAASGQAYCWGYNIYGQLGNGLNDTSSTPVAVSTSGVLSGKNVTVVSAGTNYSCAVATGKAYCWGLGTSGQLGNGTATTSYVPVAVSTSGVLNGKNVTDISAGYQQTCAVADGKAYCWGTNYSGLGDGSHSSSNVPVLITGTLTGKVVSAISVGQSHVCAVADSKAYCWGGNFWGQLGYTTGFLYGGFGFSSTPTDAGGPSSGIGSPFAITFDNLVSF